jgi:hypothetical protein
LQLLGVAAGLAEDTKANNQWHQLRAREKEAEPPNASG